MAKRTRRNTVAEIDLMRIEAAAEAALLEMAEFFNNIDAILMEVAR